MHSWHSYLFCGALALALSLTTSSCRFGNRVQEKVIPSDGLTGFYETLPVEAQACATYIPADSESAEGVPKCVPVGLDQLPAIFAEDLNGIMTNPVVFKLKKQSTDTAYLYSPFDPSSTPPAFKVTFDSNLKLELAATGEERSLSSTCTDLDVRYFGEGNLVLPETGPYDQTFGSTTVPVQGRLNMNVSALHYFDGDCASALQSLSECLKNSSACTEYSQRTLAEHIFGYYLGKELLTVEDIPRVSILEVQVLYE